MRSLCVVPSSPLFALSSHAADLARIEAALGESVLTPDPYLNEIASHLIVAGGKRLRPILTVVAAQVAGEADAVLHERAVQGGIACELVQTGSLYHDDVMDEADTRRGVDTVNAKWGNLKAILAGDFLLARASELAAGLGVEVAGLLAATIGRLCEGQLLELQHAFDVDRTEDVYLRSIGGKTASLLGSACRIGGIVAELPREHTEALTTFGWSYGMAFQVVDDVLDIVATSDQLGKPAGHDLEEGVYTLPVIRTLAGPRGAELRPLLTRDIDPATRDKAIEIVREDGGIENAISAARAFAEEGRSALATLPDSPGVTGLTAAAEYLLESVEAAAS